MSKPTRVSHPIYSLLPAAVEGFDSLAAVQANHFGVMRVHNLEETTANKAGEFAHKCLILEVSEPKQAN